jgi:hypothetical protein
MISVRWWYTTLSSDVLLSVAHPIRLDNLVLAISHLCIGDFPLTMPLPPLNRKLYDGSPCVYDDLYVLYRFPEDFLINRMVVVSVGVTRVCNAATRFLGGMCVESPRWVPCSNKFWFIIFPKFQHTAFLTLKICVKTPMFVFHDVIRMSSLSKLEFLEY